MITRLDRRGMTMIELLVVTILGMVILGAVYQILVTNQRTYTAQSAMVRDQQSLRGGIDLLLGELREVSPSDGDLVSIGDHSVTIRSSRYLGLVCSVLTTGSDPTVLARKVGGYLRGDSARVFFENNPRITGDDVWRTAVVNVIDSTGLSVCPTGGTAQVVQLEDVEFGSAASTDSITPGALIRNFEHHTYALGTYDGQPYLTQTDGGGTESPLVGPLRAQDGVEFRYLDRDGNVTGSPANVREIEVTTRTATDNVTAAGGTLQDSLRIRIHTRNSS